MSVKKNLDLGTSYLKQGQIEAAIDCFRQAVLSKPNDSDANHKLAEALNEHNMPKEAIKFYQKSIQIDDKLCWSYRGLGDAFQKQGQLEKSITAYQNALERKPDYALAQRRLKKVEQQYAEVIEKKAIESSKQKLLAFKDRHKGKRCVIIGNGPSLNKMDLSFLKHEISFGMNKIYLGFDKLGCIPSYYVSVNRLVLEQSADEILKIPSPKFVSNKGIAYLPNREDLNFIKTYPYDGDFFSTNPQNGLAEGNTVTYFALQIAYYMGFETVILIGVDHYFVTKGKPHKEVTSDGDDPNHFHPGYFGKGLKWHLPDLAGSEKYYKLANNQFRAEGRQILDATLDGHCEIFPKVDYRDLFFHKSVNPNFFLPSYPPRQEISPMYKVSLVISIGDCADNLKLILKSIIDQAYYNWEAIVVGGKINQQELDSITSSNRDKISYLELENSSIVSGYNKGLELATGDFVTFLDPSSILLSHTLSAQVNRLADSSSDIDILFSGWQESIPGTIIDIEPWQTLPDLNNWHIGKLWQLWQAVNSSPLILRRSCLENLDSFDTRLSNSIATLDLVIRLLDREFDAGWLQQSVHRRFPISFGNGHNTTSYLEQLDVEQLNIVLDKFFSQSNLSKGLTLQESQIRYYSIVWLAWLMYYQEQFILMGKYLDESLKYCSYPPSQIIVDWTEKFVAFSKSYGDKLDIDVLNDSPVWEKITRKVLTV